MTWLVGPAQLTRERWFEQVGPIAGPLAWKTHATSWHAALALTDSALAFVVAASRGTVLASTGGWPGQLAARFGACTAWSLLDGPLTLTAGPLSLNPNIASLKDYFGISAKGTIGAGFAILEMQACGYPWFGRWEEVFCLPAAKAPDYVLGRAGVLAAVEAKCTEQATRISSISSRAHGGTRFVTPACGEWMKDG